MQRIQKQVGKDRLQVIMVSVDADPDYFGDTPQTRQSVKSLLAQHGVTWPSVVELGGWAGVFNRFNLSGYGLSLVGPDGIVRGVDIHADDLDRLLKRLGPDHPARRGTN